MISEKKDFQVLSKSEHFLFTLMKLITLAQYSGLGSLLYRCSTDAGSTQIQIVMKKSTGQGGYLA